MTNAEEGDFLLSGKSLFLFVMAYETMGYWTQAKGQCNTQRLVRDNRLNSEQA